MDELAKLIIVPEKGEQIKAMYNPAQVTIDSSAQFQRTAMPGLETPVTQFVSGQNQTLSLDLFFDTYEKQEDVRVHTAKVAELVKINRELHAPPVCTFLWGGPFSGKKGETFKGVFDKVSQKFTMFLESGIPVRATLTVSITEYKTLEEQLPFIKFESADRTKRRVLKEGEQLWHHAHREFNDPALWRTIADANGIENPRLLTTGAELIIPPLEPQE